MKIWMKACVLALTVLLLAGCSQQTSSAEPIGIDAAKAVALEDAGVSAESVSFTTAGLDRRGNTEYYAVNFAADGQTYEYDIDAITGVIIEKNTPGGQSTDTERASSATDGASGTTDASAQGSTPSNGAFVGEDAAKQAALKHAGLEESQVTFLCSYLDWDDGRQVYDVEFYTEDRKEYDYEIDAYTGDVLSYDYDAEASLIGNTGSGKEITAAEAKSLALAQVPGATESDIWEFSTDIDDGRLEYEGEIHYDGSKYDFTIDGYSGTIREWEVERYGR